MAKTKTYRGMLTIGSNSEDDDILFLDEDILAEVIEEDIDEWGGFLSVRYFTAERAMDPDELSLELIRVMEGFGSADYQMRYSEITGYLWTDEELNVGGHDLLQELKDQAGRFCHLEIEYAKDDRRTPAAAEE